MARSFLFWANALFLLAGHFAFSRTNAPLHSENEVPKRFFFNPSLGSLSRELKSFSEKEGVAFSLYDFRKHRLVASCGVDALERPQPMGSILKPFVALAAWASGPDAGPSSDRGERPGEDLERRDVVCLPSEKSVPVSEACWNRRGHGPVTFSHSLALSCNFFFASLAEGMDEGAWSNTFRLFHLEAPVFKDALSPERKRALAIGSDPDFLVTPSRLFFAYLALFGENLPSGTATNGIPASRLKKIREALALTQQIGTVKNQKHFQVPASVKTGTSFAMEMEDGEIDPVRTCGWAFAALPRDKPRLAILLRKNHSTGAAGAYPELVKLLEAFYHRL